jgi:hypothetical protein
MIKRAPRPFRPASVDAEHRALDDVRRRPHRCVDRAALGVLPQCRVAGIDIG